MIQVSYKMGHNGVDGWVQRPNSAGGVSVSFTLKNLSEKQIKYYVLSFIPYNSVGDAVPCTVKDCVERGVRGTGPINQNGKDGGIFENAWYNHSISSVKLTKAEIEYMDGTTETIKGEDIKPVAGCYVATAVYGSYNCPEVWTLRRYRDTTLASTWHGRAFIHTYYAISPTLVKLFGDKKWFKKMWKGKLDRMVSKLNKQGVENTPYDDKNWN